MNSLRQTTVSTPPSIRCAIYTRKSTEEGLDQQFNSLDAQRDSSEAFSRPRRIRSERLHDRNFISFQRHRVAGKSGTRT